MSTEKKISRIISKMKYIIVDGKCYELDFNERLITKFPKSPSRDKKTMLQDICSVQKEKLLESDLDSIQIENSHSRNCSKTVTKMLDNFMADKSNIYHIDDQSLSNYIFDCNLNIQSVFNYQSLESSDQNYNDVNRS